MSVSAFGVEDIRKADDQRKSVRGAAATGAIGGAVGTQLGVHGAVHGVLSGSGVSDSYRGASVGRKLAMHAQAAPHVARDLTTTKPGLALVGSAAAIGAGANAAHRAFKNRKKQPVAKSAFGVEDPRLSKAMGDEAAKALSVAHKAGEHAKSAVKACPSCGPGSQRARMSMRAWESQSASHTRAS